MSAFLISFYGAVAVFAVAGFVLSIRALRRGERFNAAMETLLSLAIGALAVVPVML